MVREISNGGLYRQSVRCGKANCRCATGHLHRGYWYFFTRVEGKLRKFYVPLEAVESFAQVVNAAAEQKQASRQSLRDSKRLLNEMRLRLR